MKRCPTCQEEFADQFGFCPVDGTPLSNGFNASSVEAAQIKIPAASNARESHTASVVTESETTHAAAASNKNAEPISAASPSNGDRAAEAGVGAAAVAGASASSGAMVPAGRGEYHLTFINEEGLVSRLTKELREVAHESELTWPEFKRDPWGFTKRGLTAYGKAAGRTFSQPNVAAGIIAAFVVMLTAVGLYQAYEHRCSVFHVRCQQAIADNVREDLEFQGMITEIPEEQKKPDEGNAGNAKGNGGGSKPQQEKPHGGGGGGRNEVKPASFGKLPPASLTVPQIVAPDPHPPTIKNPHLPTPASIVADPTLFPPDPRPLPYGDPKSRSTETSSGPGTGNGIGTGTGGGVGSGEGGGVGPGRGGNTGGGDRSDGGGGPGGGGGGGDYTRTFSQKEVTRKAIVLSRPEPTYTEEARKNSVTGEVTLRVVLSSSGQVTNITPIKRLPDGLTEKAIAAARQIQFQPAEKDGHKVSQYATIVYNFNIY